MNTLPTFQIYNASAGSGKTFTLVKEYLKIILNDTGSNNEGFYVFQNILAITFTNKAATEMKERILENLQAFSEKKENDLFFLLMEELNIEKEDLFSRSKKVLDAILQNYSAFNITTIDSFTYKIVRTFAYDLGLPLNFEVEMDPSQLLNEAIDVLISKIGIDTKLTETLIDYSIQKINNDKSWDISHDLNSISRILLNEEDAAQFKKLENIELQDFKKVNRLLQNEKQKIEKLFIAKGEEGMRVIDDSNLLYNDFPYSELPNFFKKLINFKSQKKDTIKFSGRLYNKVSSGVLYATSKGKEVKERIDEITPQLSDLYFEAEQLYKIHFADYMLMDLVSKSLIPLAVLNHIQFELSKIKDQNNIRFNGEFNQLISEKIKNEPAPFIYERIGEKFSYYFIDEMQDTSQLQWQNLIPLIDNALSQEKGRLMLVGDGKQAIYRWRGGKAEQFIDLSEDENPFFVQKESKNLGTNFRSFSEIINFNNNFFTHISQFLTNEQYQFLYQKGSEQKNNSNTGGYVQIEFVDKYDMSSEEKINAYPQKVFEVISTLDASYNKSEVCILVRGKKEGVQIASYLTERGVKIISSETLLVQNSVKVQFIVQLLSYINNPIDLNSKFDAVLFLYDFLEIKINKHQFFEELIPLEINEFFDKLKDYQIRFNFEEYLKLPFYEGVETMIRSFYLMKNADAYVQFFMDFVLDFQRKNKNELAGFIQVWNDKKDKLSIVSHEDKDAVRIMTIHKSKGLEFPVVIFPCDLNVYKEQEAKVWYENLDSTKFGEISTSLVSCSSSLEMTGKQGSELLERRKEELALDNFNLLYVALTRAVEQLYLITDYKKESKTSSNLDFYSGLYKNFLTSFLDLGEESVYQFGDRNRKTIPKGKLTNVEVEEQQLYISSSWEDHDIEIVSNSSKNWGEVSEDSIKYGLLIHEILSKIYSKEDIEGVLNEYILKGELENENKTELISILDMVVNHPKLIKYFKKGLTVINERAITTEKGSLLIPDRLIIDKKTVVIIDYKTGKKEKSHQAQLESYANVLKRMGFIVLERLLVYIGNQIEVECF